MNQLKIGDKVMIKNNKNVYTVGSLEYRDGDYDLALYSAEGRDMLEIVVSPDDIMVLL